MSDVFASRLAALIAAEAHGEQMVTPEEAAEAHRILDAFAPLRAEANRRFLGPPPVTADDCLQELIDLVSDGGCTTCPMQSYSEYRHCTLGPDDGDKSERPCRMGWRAWLERRVRSRPCPTEQQ